MQHLRWAKRRRTLTSSSLAMWTLASLQPLVTSSTSAAALTRGPLRSSRKRRRRQVFFFFSPQSLPAELPNVQVAEWSRIFLRCGKILVLKTRMLIILDPTLGSTVKAKHETILPCPMLSIFLTALIILMFFSIFCGG